MNCSYIKGERNEVLQNSPR